MFLGTIILSFLIWYLMCRWRNRAFFDLAKQLNNSIFGVSLPIIGQSYILLRGNAEDRMKTFKKLGKQTTDNGGVAAFWHTDKIFILVSDAEVADILMKTCLEKILMDFFTYLLGNASILVAVKEWRPRRKATSPIFNQRNLKRFVPMFARQSEKMADRLRTAAARGVFAAGPYTNAYTVDTICESTFGVNVDIQDKGNHPFPASVQKMMKMANDFATNPIFHNQVMFKLLCYFTGNNKSGKIVNDFVDNVIREKQKHLEQAAAQEIKSDNPSPQKGLITLMELYMQSCEGGKKMTAVELREEGLLLILAASDTTAVAIAFTMMMLARYPEVQEKVYKELQEVLGKTYRTPTYADLPRLKYLEAVIKESMRLYPPVPFVLRRVHKDVTLPNGVTLVKGCAVLIMIEAVHRNPKYWGPDADSFKPERFLNSALAHPAAYMPFSYGPRGCVGYKYAMMSILTALATLLQQYRVLPPEHSPGGSTTTYDEASNPLRLKFDILTKEAHSFTMQLESRQ